MDALMASYASDTDSDGGEPASVSGGAPEVPEPSALLPPPPLDLLQPPNFVDYSAMAQGGRVRSFPHVEGNYAVHVYIPVVIPSDARKQLALSMKRAASLVPDLYAVDADYALSELCKDEQKLEKVLLSREFHVSLGRPVAVQVHQIDSFIAMLRQKFQPQQQLGYSCLVFFFVLFNFCISLSLMEIFIHVEQRYWMEFNKWEHFVNDDCTRSFVSLEVTRTGLPEITRQILMVDEVYRLHGLPEFYTNPRPHISLVWALGDVSGKLKQALKDIEKYQSSMSSLQKCNVRCKFSRVVCKVGKKVHDICKVAD
ncbi:U6 snRNA phosphodiesterase [Zea mays]|uniref:U6 snRNA phosphodiesterase n=1 Tax=Zea mays TaxID=4577 RepID=A0A3L6EV73_MAIZE|nr:U6 snRNA phosphodiesterase [Zea mays]